MDRDSINAHMANMDPINARIFPILERNLMPTFNALHRRLHELAAMARKIENATDADITVDITVAIKTKGKKTKKGKKKRLDDDVPVNQEVPEPPSTMEESSESEITFSVQRET